MRMFGGLAKLLSDFDFCRNLKKTRLAHPLRFSMDGIRAADSEPFNAPRSPTI